MELEFPLDTRVTLVGLWLLYNSAVGLFAQARDDAAQQEDKEEHADPNLRKMTMIPREGERGCMVAPTWILWDLEMGLI